MGVNRKVRSIVISLALFIGLAVTGIAVQKTQDTRRKAAEFFNGDLVSFSHNEGIVRKNEGKIYFVEVFADTASSEKVIDSIDIGVDYSNGLNIIDGGITSNDCVISNDTNNIQLQQNGVPVEGALKRTILNIRCNRKGGKLNILTLKLKANYPTENDDWIFRFDTKIADVFADISDENSKYAAQWVSGYGVWVNFKNNSNPPSNGGEYKCYKKVDMGPRFVTAVDTGYYSAVLNAGTTLAVYIGINTDERVFESARASLSYDRDYFAFKNFYNLKEGKYDIDYYPSGYDSYVGLFDILFQRSEYDENELRLYGDYLVKIVFDVLKKPKTRTTIRFVGESSDESYRQDNYSWSQDRYIKDYLGRTGIVIYDNFENGKRFDNVNSYIDNHGFFFINDLGNILRRDILYVWLNEQKDKYELVDNEHCEMEYKPGYECWEDKQHGDYDGDYWLSGNDYVVWRNEFIDKYFEVGVKSDGNCDGKSSVSDYSLWRENYVKN